jgi:hypothetical protein
MMARFNELMVGRYNRFLQKLLGFKGGPPAAQLASEIQPVMALHQPGSAETRYLEGWNRFSFGRGANATVGITGAIRIRNPLTSNLIAAFETLMFASTVGDLAVLRLAATNNDLPTVFVVGNKRLDPRGQPDSALITSENSGGGGTLLQARAGIKVPANSTGQFVLHINQEYQLLPGDAIEISGTALNQGIDSLSFLWRERFLEESERT